MENLLSCVCRWMIDEQFRIASSTKIPILLTVEGRFGKAGNNIAEISFSFPFLIQQLTFQMITQRTEMKWEKKRKIFCSSLYMRKAAKARRKNIFQISLWIVIKAIARSSHKIPFSYLFSRRLLLLLVVFDDWRLCSRFIKHVCLTTLAIATTNFTSNRFFTIFIHKSNKNPLENYKKLYFLPFQFIITRMWNHLKILVLARIWHWRQIYARHSQFTSVKSWEGKKMKEN